VGELLAAALGYAARGWAVFPCAERGKVPITSRGCLEATTDRAQVERWWSRTPGANVGIACGRASGIVVVDLDGEDGIATWGRLIEQGSPRTAVAQTGSGGWHVFYALPPGERARNTARRLGPGIDTRGDGGYVVAAPSVHPSGGRYAWRRDIPLAAAPAWLLEAVRRPRQVEAPAPVVRMPGLGPSAYARAALERGCEEVRGAGQGARNHTLNAVAYSLGRLVGAGEIGRDEVEHHLVHAARDAGLDGAEIMPTITSGVRAGMAEPRAVPPAPSGSSAPRAARRFAPMVAGPR